MAGLEICENCPKVRPNSEPYVLQPVYTGLVGEMALNFLPKAAVNVLDTDSKRIGTLSVPKSVMDASWQIKEAINECDGPTGTFIKRCGAEAILAVRAKQVNKGELWQQ